MAEEIPPAPITQVAASTPVKAAQAPKMEKFRGAIIVVDGLKKTFDVKKMVTVKGKKEEKAMTFTTDDKTKITKKKEVKAFADLKAGMNVTVAYKVAAGKNLAVDVKIATPKTAPKPKDK
jgi:ribosomal protein L19